MREIGEFKDEEKANTFSAFLSVEGIENQAEEDDGVWSIWVCEEECIERASRELIRFRENPHRPEYLKAAGAAKTDVKSKEEEPPYIGRYKQVDLGRKWRNSSRAGHANMVLMIFSTAVFLLTDMGGKLTNSWIQGLSINEYANSDGQSTWSPRVGLANVSSGELWRLFTPVFIHFGSLHLIFNMLWLFWLGGMIENRKGAFFFAFFVLLTGITSNLGQYFEAGPVFGGMSGVVYALFGYAWIKGKFDPGDGIGVPPSTVLIMLTWFFLCFTPVFPNIANAAHAIGLFLGASWGYVSAVKWRR